MKAILKLFNVSFQYPNGDGLRRINLTVNNGESVFLVGPSGAGKTTLLKLIYLAEFPQEGHILLNEFNSLWIRKKDIPFLRRKIGVVFQDFKLLRDRNVFDNVAFALEVTGARRRKIKRRVLEVLKDVGLSHKRLKMPDELSGGEQQRVAIARALVNEPFILLADEPTGNLDRESAIGVLDILTRINTMGTAVLMATHNYELAQQTGQRIIRIDNGTIVS